MKNAVRILILSIVLFVTGLFYHYPTVLNWVILQFTARKTVQDRLNQYQGAVESRLLPLFRLKNVEFPPKNVTLVFIKNELVLKLYAGPEGKKPSLIKNYQVLAASGKSGPKLREGDSQVPEGIYRIESLNPNSLYHLSLRLNYPNSFDREKAQMDDRTELGSDIMIHGKNLSIGCIAIGDEAIEEVFVLAALTEYQKWKIILSPNDLLKAKRIRRGDEPVWISNLDAEIEKNLSELN